MGGAAGGGLRAVLPGVVGRVVAGSVGETLRYAPRCGRLRRWRAGGPRVAVAVKRRPRLPPESARWGGFGSEEACRGRGVAGRGRRECRRGRARGVGG